MGPPNDPQSSMAAPGGKEKKIVMSSMKVTGACTPEPAANDTRYISPSAINELSFSLTTNVKTFSPGPSVQSSGARGIVNPPVGIHRKRNTDKAMRVRSRCFMDEGRGWLPIPASLY